MEAGKKLNTFQLWLIRDNLIDYLPEWQQIYSKSHAFKILFEDVVTLLETPIKERFDAKQKLSLSMSNFNHLCENDPECLNVKKNIELNQEIRDKNRKTEVLYKNYIQTFLKEN